MRVFLAAGATVALALASCGGCSSTQMPSFLPSFGAKTKSSKPHTSGLTNAPPAPHLKSMSGVSPSVSMPPSASWSNLPVYPGTNYPQTPYPQQAALGGGAPAYSTYASGGSGTAPQYGAMPPAGAASPYSQYPASGGQAYTAQQAPSYGAGQAPSYAQQQAAPYGGQASPYTAPQDPYGATSEPYNAAPSYGSHRR